MVDVSSSSPPATPSTGARVFPFEDVHSDAFRNSLLQAHAESTFDADGSFGLFRVIQGSIGSSDASYRVSVWNRVLEVIRGDDQEKYQALHKGEPFYWMALASYQMRDFEGALFYMDCALAEDIQNHKPRWQALPAGLFVRLDDSSKAQAGLAAVEAIRKEFDRACDGANSQFNLAFNVQEYRNRLVARATAQHGRLRSAVTAFITFLAECSDRRRQLDFAPEHARESGTAEPFLLHLFKGCVLFETLLKSTNCAPNEATTTLGGLLTCTPLHTALGSDTPIRKLGSFTTLDEFFNALHGQRTGGSIGPFEDLRAVWALRNLIGHNLALPRRPTTVEYDEMFMLVFAAIARVMLRLYPPA